MIKSVRLVNFFSFGDCTIDLESDLNVLVGINGSGKSNFLRAFQLLKAGMDGRLQEQFAQWGGIDNVMQKAKGSKGGKGQIEMVFTIGHNSNLGWSDKYVGDIIYHITFVDYWDNDYSVNQIVTRPDGYNYFKLLTRDLITDKDSDSEKSRKFEENKKGLLTSDSIRGEIGLFRLYRFLKDVDYYKQFNTADDAPLRVAVRATGVDRLLPNGDNMFQVLNTVGLKSSTAYDAIESGLHDVNEHFQRFRMNVYGQGSVEFYLQEKGLETPIHAAQVSDGTLCYLCLLVAVHQPDRGSTIIFDEPERNLHPDMLFELGRQLEKASEKSQIILTTHAPGLVNQFPLRAVRVFEKDENNQTIVNKFTEEDFAGWYDEFAPGQMWRDGALGGNR